MKGYKKYYFVLLFLGSVIMVLPFLWMLTTSLKAQTEVFSIPISWIPSKLIFKNYTDAFKLANFSRLYFNTIIVTLGIIALQMSSSILAAFAFARYNFKGKEILFAILLIGLMVPEQTIMIPLVQLLTKLNWLNTYHGMIIPFGWSAVIVFLFRNFFEALPREIEEAAIIDGCGTLGVLRYVILPMSKGIISTAFILVFMYGWNQYLFPLLIAKESKMHTIQVGLSALQDSNEAFATNWPVLMSATSISIIPVIVIYIIFQKKVIDSIAFSGSKE